MSDLSDLVQKPISFIKQAECPTTHKGRQLIHTIFPVTVDNLFSLLYRNSKFLHDFHTKRKSSDMNFTDWQTDKNGKTIRKVTITVPLTNPVLPKRSHVTETMELDDCSKPGELYSFNGIVINQGIPYADSFYLAKHYCLSRTIDNQTEISVYGEIKYKKSVFSFVKAIIEKNLWSGLEEFYTSLMIALQSEYGRQPPIKTKAGRKKRMADSQPKPNNDEAQPKQDVIKNALEQLRTVYQENLELRGERDKLLTKAQLRIAETNKRARKKNTTVWLLGILLVGLIVCVLYLK